MPRFFTETIDETKGIITGDDAKHIAKVLRMKAGEKLVACDCQGRDYDCVISEVCDKQVELTVEKVYPSETEPSVKVTLYQAMPKSDKMELIIQKAVELGVYEIIPVETKRCVVKLDDKKAKSKIARWQGIAEAAAKQSKRGIVPQVSDVVSFAQAIKRASEMDLKLIPYELAEGMDKSRELLAQAAPGQDIAIFIGPEGGFEEREIEAALELGIRPITLGKRILRTETAGLAILAWLVYQLEQ